MANTVTNTNNLSLRSILEKDKLTGPNFLDWERNLQIVLRHERKWYVLEEPLGEAPPANASTAIRNAYQKRSDDLLDVGCLMLATMSPELQTGLMNTNAYDMIRQLRDMFQTQARTERYDATRALNACKMAKGTSVSAHVMKMKRLLDHLERLGHPVPLQLATDTILNSLSDDYKQFVINFNMNNMERSIAELHSMLKTTEQSMGTGTKTKDVLMVRDGGVKKKRGQRNTSKGKDQVQVSQSVPKAVDNRKGKGMGKKVKVNKAKTENRCFRCHEVGHWRQNCPKRHETEIFIYTATKESCGVDFTYSRNLELFQYLQDLGNMSNSYKRCRPKTARIFDRAANIGCDPLTHQTPNTMRRYKESAYKMAANEKMSGINNDLPPPPPTAPTGNSGFTLLPILAKEKLVGPNYLDWMRALRLTLRYENKEYVLDEQIVEIDHDTASPEEINAYSKHCTNSTKSYCIMVSTMSSELQKMFDESWAYEINEKLREMFAKGQRQERLEVLKALKKCQHRDGESVCAHVQKMQRLIERLEKLDVKFDKNLAIDMVLDSLPDSYDPFIMQFHMNDGETNMMQLHNLLQRAEEGMKKSHALASSTDVAQVNAIRTGKGKKRKATAQPAWKGKAHVGESNKGSKRTVQWPIGYSLKDKGYL
ncbi:hypothetical protein OSB04_009586 [Centaurea solstitialis]|uniref:CCHC-type domain-containing protein n=1 Tax=Centaurea solstitialis TaxID=347529 RepID=A0AA38WC20_9ASTR|nr:hypothetical protein OSB04_009586 [Centaurea solstitialis]